MGIVDLASMAPKVEARSGRIALMSRYHTSPRKIEDDYTFSDKVLGRGVSGPVRLAISNTSPDREFAVKTFYIAKMEEIEKRHFKDELATFLCVDHPHVVRLIDVYETEECVSLVMECLNGGELLERVRSTKRFTEKKSADTIRQMLLAVNYLHCNGIVHRDLKLENFLYDTRTSDHLKLIDFGFSKFWESNFSSLNTTCGSLSYVAPEVLRGNYGSQCDMWSIGVMSFALLSGSMPFVGDKQEKAKKIALANYDMTAGVWSKISTTAKSFVANLLAADPKVRFSAKTALAHPWILRAAPTVDTPLKADSHIFNSLSAWRSVPRLQRAYLTLLAWNLTNKEQEKVRDYFIALDSDFNGVISLSELKKAMPSGKKVDERVLQETFQSLKHNDDEEIHYSDFLAALMSSRINDLEETLLQSTFQKFDKSGHGYITSQDFQDIVGKEYDGENSQTVLLEADIINVDGHVDYAEFTHYLQMTSTGANIWEHLEDSRDSKLTDTDPVVCDAKAARRKEVDSVTHQGCCSIM